MAEGRRKPREKKKFRILFYLLLLCCFCVLAQRGYGIFRIHQEQQAALERIEKLKAQQAQLELEQKKLNEPEYVEKLAREDFNMVGKDEVPIFVVEEDKGK